MIYDYFSNKQGHKRDKNARQVYFTFHMDVKFRRVPMSLFLLISPLIKYSKIISDHLLKMSMVFHESIQKIINLRH